MDSSTPAFLGGSPTLDNQRHVRWPIITDDDRRAVARVFDRGILSGAAAPEAVAFEREFAEFVGARHALLTHCGTSALHIALAGAGVRAGDEVIVPAYSFVASALAALHHGAIPVFVDVAPDTHTLDAAALEAAITPRTRAVMPVHIHGAPADLDAIAEVAKRHGIAVIEDAAQAHGATYRGTPVGAIGAAGGFSLQSSKHLPAGEGGVFVTNDDAIAEHANRLRNFGENVGDPTRAAGAMNPERPLDSDRAYVTQSIGWMYRGNEMQAALARSQLTRLPELTARCQQNATRLDQALAELPGVSRPRVPDGAQSVHHKYRVLVDPAAAGVSLSPAQLRDALRRALVAEGLEVVMWQSQPLPAHGLFARAEGFGRGYPWSLVEDFDPAEQYRANRFPVARDVLERSLVLFSQSCPLIAQQKDVVDAYAQAFARVWQHRHELPRLAAGDSAAGSNGSATTSASTSASPASASPAKHSTNG